MNRTNGQLAVMVAALVLLGAQVAGAQTPAAPPQAAEVRAPEAPPSSPPGGETHAHMRSSHTVDVIAPGEKVDTILGRMRPERSTPPPRADAVRPPPGSDSRGGQGSSGTGRTEQSRPLENGRDNGRDVGRAPSMQSPRNDGATPPPYSPRPTPTR